MPSHGEKQTSAADRSNMFFFSPSVLPQELVLKLLQVLAQPLLLLSGLLELHHQLLPVRAGGGKTQLFDLLVNDSCSGQGGQSIYMLQVKMLVQKMLE